MNDPLVAQQMVRRRVLRRRRWRRVRRGVLVALAVLAVGSAAFGIDRMVVSLQRYYGGRPHASSTTVLPVATTAPTTTTTPGPPPCVSAQLSAQVWDWVATNGTTYETVALTNISLAPCTLAGFAGIGASAQNGTALPAPAQQVATLGVTAGTSPGAVAVGPQLRAWFELAFPNTCNQILAPGAVPAAASSACYAGTTLQVIPPRSQSALLVYEPLRFTYGATGFQVGPFQSGSPPPSPPIPQ